MNRQAQTGFTLVELLIVIGILGMLMQLLLPAVEMARESARRTQCINNLRQLGVGVMQHTNVQEHYPSNGWGWNWVGDPDHGYGKDQPGGWIFNTLDYLEQGHLRALGRGLTQEAKVEAMKKMISTPIPNYICPSRRLPRAYEVSAEVTHGEFKFTVEKAARSDYVINVGHEGWPEANGHNKTKFGWQPANMKEALDPKFFWFITTGFTGVSFGRSQVRPEQITDGTTHTYLIGEKFIQPDHYKNGRSGGDNETMYTGFNNDNGRTAEGLPLRDTNEVGELPLSGANQFGSAHPSTWQIILCDGSVHSLSYDIDIEVHRRLANRSDGEVVSIGRDSL